MLEAAAEAQRPRLRTTLAASETLKAAGLAAATLASNAVALVFTVLFARILGADGYGSLAALLSTFLILAVPGAAVQVAVARETAMGRLGTGAELAATLSRWRRTLLIACAVVAVVAGLLREQIAAVLSVDEVWAAAATLPTGCLWLLLSVERGALQGQHAYRPVAWSLLLEASGRLAIGARAGRRRARGQRRLPRHAAVDAGGGRRARLGRAPAARRARRAATTTESLRELMRGAWPAVLGLFLVAVLQNVDVILVKRQIGGDEAGAYAAAAVAAKAVVWVAIGVGLYLLPAAVRRARRGRRPAAGAAARAGGRLARGAADAARLRGRARAGAAAGVRRGDGRGRGRAVHARAGDDAAGGRLPVRAVHARPATA